MGKGYQLGTKKEGGDTVSDRGLGMARRGKRSLVSVVEGKRENWRTHENRRKY